MRKENSKNTSLWIKSHTRWVQQPQKDKNSIKSDFVCSKIMSDYHSPTTIDIPS